MNELRSRPASPRALDHPVHDRPGFVRRLLRPTRRRLSLTRSVLVLSAVAGSILGTTALARSAVERLTPEPNVTWFGAYVDTTLVPRTAFETLRARGTSTIVLGFVVADDTKRCQPSWGTFLDLDQAADSIALDRRLVRLRDRGGEPVVSFGGALNDELAVACTDQDALTAAYRSVIDRYDLRVIDLDIEGAALADQAAHRRRAVAMKNLQTEARADKRRLDVWVTLPVAPTGLPASAVSLVDEMLRAGVDLTGVNVMTMNYGGSRTGGMSMAEATRTALFATARQLDGAYQRRGVKLTNSQLWRRLGATPMIGQNDEPTDRFTLDDADDLNRFARQYGLGRLSMWSIDRDHPCPEVAEQQRVSNTCSGAAQRHHDFLRVLSRETLDRPSVAATQPAPSAAVVRGATRDDAATAPYPIWRNGKVYDLGDKVVWYQNVYEAKWWSRGAAPDSPVVHEWDSPWRYLGPVLPTDVPLQSRLLKPGTYPSWDPKRTYQAGVLVQVGGRAFRATQWSMGVPPDPDPDEPWSSPWKLLPLPPAGQ